MEAATTPDAETQQPLAVPEPDPVEIARAEHSPAEHRNTSEMFRFSDYVHVGPGAEECEDAESGKCTNDMHFHAWCRLPNQFQHDAIREKALAAKARRLRQFRDDDSDASVILDSALDEIEDTLGEEDARESYIAELTSKDFMKDYFEVVQELKHEEGEEGEESEWASIEEDKERLRALQATPEADRAVDEMEELVRHCNAFDEACGDRIKERQEKIKEALSGLPIEQLRSEVRGERVKKDTTSVYMQTYTIWEHYIGTMRMKVPPKVEAAQERVFKSIEHLKAAAPEVVKAIDEKYTELDGDFGQSLSMGSVGKG